MWTLAFEHHEDRALTQGYEPTREAAGVDPKIEKPRFQGHCRQLLTASRSVARAAIR